MVAFRENGTNSEIFIWSLNLEILNARQMEFHVFLYSSSSKGDEAATSSY